MVWKYQARNASTSIVAPYRILRVIEMVSRRSPFDRLRVTRGDDRLVYIIMQERVVGAKVSALATILALAIVG